MLRSFTAIPIESTLPAQIKEDDGSFIESLAIDDATGVIYAGQTAINSGTRNLIAGANITLTPSGSGLIIAASGGGGGNPGGSVGQLQFNNSSSFGGAPFSSVNATTGDIEWNNGSDRFAQLIFNDGNPNGPGFAFVGPAGNCEIAAQGLFLSGGGKITQLGTGHNGLTGQTIVNVFEPGTALVVVYDPISAGGLGMEVEALNNADSQNSTAVIIQVWGETPHAATLTGVNLTADATDGGGFADTIIGINLEDINGGTGATTVTGILISDVNTLGATNYAIKTGLGQVFLGDQIVMDDGAGQTLYIVPTGSSGPSLQTTKTGTGFAEIAALGLYLSNGAKISQVGTGANVLSGSLEVSNILSVLPSYTDDGASGTTYTAGTFQASLYGANISTDVLYSLLIKSHSLGTGGPAEVTGIYIASNEITSSSIGNIQAGIHIANQTAYGFIAGVTNAAILIDDQESPSSDPGGAILSLTIANAGAGWQNGDFATITTGDGTASIVINSVIFPVFGIIGVDQGSQFFTIAGDQTASFTPSFLFSVSGSTGNNGNYTVVSATFTSGNTNIVVVESIPSPVADGTLDGVLGYISGFSFATQGSGYGVGTVPLTANSPSLGVNATVTITAVATSGANVYSIKTGLGPNLFGDVTSIVITPAPSASVSALNVTNNASDFSGTGSLSTGATITLNLTGSDIDGDGAIGILVSSFTEATGAALYNKGISIGVGASPTTINQYGIEIIQYDNWAVNNSAIIIRPQDTSGSSTNYGLQIGDLTGASTNSAIVTGLGPSVFGDQVSISSIGQNALVVSTFFTDDAGQSIEDITVGEFSGTLTGENTAGDNMHAVDVFSESTGFSGSPNSTVGIHVNGCMSTNVASVLQTGILISDQATGVQASSVNAGIVIEDQTAGATVYAIITGLGPVSFGDTATFVGPVTITGTGGFGSYLTFTGASAGTAQIAYKGSVTPNPLLLPTTTGAPNQYLKTDGGLEQQLSWDTPAGAGTIGGTVSSAHLVAANGADNVADIPGTSADFTTGQINLSVNATTGTLYGLFSVATLAAAGTTTDCFGVFGHAIGTNTTNSTTSDIWGGYFIAEQISNFDGEGLHAVTGVAKITGSASMSSAIAFFAQSPVITGGGSTPATYGIFIDDQTGGTANFAIQTGLGDIAFGNSGGNFGIFGTTPAPIQTVSGVKLPSDVVLANLLTALVSYGLIIDSST